MNKFNAGHFTKNTIAEYRIGPCGESKRLSVNYLISNGSGSWVIITNDDPYLMINIDHVDKIISSGSKKLDIKVKPIDIGITKNSLNQKIIKHKSQYACFHDIHNLVCYITSRLCSYDMIVDYERLSNKLEQSGVFSRHLYTEKDWGGDWVYYFTANKKKLKKRIKQLLPGCLMSIKEAMAIEREYYSNLYSE